MGVLASAVRRVALPVAFYLSDRRQIDGVVAAVLSGSIGIDEFADRSRRALALLRTHDERQLKKVQRYLRRLVLVAAGGEMYVPEIGGYLVDARVLANRSDLEFASAIVHESTHARLHRRGIAYTERTRRRVEAICVQEEIAFLQRIIGTEQLIGRKRNRVQRGGWWSEKEMYERRADQMRAHGLPQWILQLHRKIFGPRDAVDSNRKQ